MTVKHLTSGGKSAAKPWRFYIFLIFIFWLTTIIYLGADNVIQEKGRQIEAVKQEITAIKTENDKLRLHIAVLSSPQRIESVATDTLGMVPADNSAKVFYIPQ